MTTNNVGAVSFLLLLPMALPAQQSGREHNVAPLKQWAAPLYWQPTSAEARANVNEPATGNAAGILATSAPPPNGTSALVFVAMTPCRLADTRTGQGFTCAS